MQLVLLVGTGRCGSTLLSNMLRTHPAVMSASELFASLRPHPFSSEPLDGSAMWTLLTTPRRLSTVMADNDILPTEFLYPVGRGRYSARDVPPIAATTLPHLVDDPDALLDELDPVVRSFPMDTIGRHYERILMWLATRFDRQVVVERSGASLEYLSDMYTAFPHASIVHVCRDAMPCALSMREHHLFRMAQIGSRLARELGFDPYLDEESKFDPLTVSEGLRPLLPDRFDRSTYDCFPLGADEFGWMWSALIMAGLPTLKRLPPSRLHTLHYEDLLAQPRATIGSLAQFIGLSDAAGWLDEAASTVKPRDTNRLSDLDPTERRRLARSVAFASKSLARSKGSPVIAS